VSSVASDAAGLVTFTGTGAGAASSAAADAAGLVILAITGSGTAAVSSVKATGSGTVSGDDNGGRPESIFTGVVRTSALS
jgi:hypothetical protein